MSEAEGSVYGVNALLYSKTCALCQGSTARAGIHLCRDTKIPHNKRVPPLSLLTKTRQHCKVFIAVGVTVLNGFDDTSVFIKGSHFFHGTTSFSRAQKFVQSRQMASNQLLLQMTT